jgi:hypothetical protein
MSPATHENQISYQSYCQLGGCRNSALQKVERHNGSHTYTTYHSLEGMASWKQDLPAGPSDTR